MHPQEINKLFELINQLNDKVDLLMNKIPRHQVKQSRSEQINDLAAAFALAQSEYPQIGFNRNNPFFKSKYADLDAIMYAIRPILGKHGLAFFCDTDMTNDERHLVYAQLVHKSGQWISSTTRIVPESQDKNYNQAYAKSLSYLKRHQAMALLNVTCTDDPVDNDVEYEYPDPRPMLKPEPTLVRSSVDPSYDTITKEQWEHLSTLLREYPDICENILKSMKIKSLRDFPKDKFEPAVRKINELIYEYKNIKSSQSAI